MIPIAAGARIWVATGHTDMRKGMQGLALLVQESLGRGNAPWSASPLPRHTNDPYGALKTTSKAKIAPELW